MARAHPVIDKAYPVIARALRARGNLKPNRTSPSGPFKLS